MKKDISEAMFCNAMPCNPLPFLNAIMEHVREHGTESIRSDEVKQVLWVVMAQAYGQMATIDMHDEWSRLYKLREKHDERDSCNHNL